jgi:trimethylamine--corrinoid protein Co-methyltransferase
MSKINSCPDQVLGYTLITQADAELIHEATLDIMETVGVKVPGKEAHEIYSSAGCQCDPETGIVKFPRNLVNDLIEACPASFELYGRDPKYNFTAGDGKPKYLNFGTGVEVRDIVTGERRPSTKEDIGTIARFVNELPEVDLFHVPVTAGDVTPFLKDLHEGEAGLLNTSKHFIHHNNCGKNTRRWIEMAAAVAGGKDQLREKPITTMVLCPNSPLEITEHVGEIIIESAKAGLPMNILSMGLAGATTPVTMAGTLVVTNSEFLAGMVLAQLINKGNRLIYGSSTTIMDMQWATTPVGAPEIAMAGCFVSAMGKFYGIPAYVGGT